MALQIELGKGPLVTEVTREQAIAAVKNHPLCKSAAAHKSLTIDEVEGRWVAAFVRDAGGPPFGGPADGEEESPGPKSEGPDDTSDGSDGPPEPPDAEGEDDSEGPPKEKSDKGGDKELLHHIMDTLTQITVALGLPDASGADSNPVPGAEDTPLPPDGPPGAPPAPAHSDGIGEDGKQHIVHERALKPGDVPPGGTPVGSPAFSSVSADHPWAQVVGHASSFELDEAIGSAPMSQVWSETEHLAKTAGYKVKQLYEYTTDEGERRAHGQVSVY